MKYIPSRRRFDLIDDMFDGFFPSELNHQGFDSIMKTDIHEKDGYYTLDIEIPGYNKDEVSMELSNGYLSIKAVHNDSEEEKDKKGNLIRCERRFGSCSRSFYVGENIKASDVKAKFENGMLIVTVPSAEQKQIESKETIAIE